MRYTEEMMLQSKSGFCMPFEERGKDVELTLGYGKQKRYRALAMMRHTASTKWYATANMK